VINPTQPNLLRRYQNLLAISRDLASTLDLNVLLDRIVHAAAELSDAQEASILLYDQTKGELYFHAATNLDEPMRRGLTVPVDSSIAGWIVTNRQPIIISDAQQDTRHFGQIATVTNVETRSLLGVPMITKDKVVGALEAINKRSGQFTPDDQEMLSALGAQAAVAIENARLFQQSDLIAELVHELRTPMASLNTAVHLLLHPDLPDEQRSRIAAIVRDETFRISELASSFLDLARLESGRAQFQPEFFFPRQLLEDCSSFMNSRAAEKNIQLILESPEALPEIKADRDKIKQVLLNLLSNAIKFNKPEGIVRLAARASQGELIIEVGDAGPGIPAENLPRLFQKFYRVPGAEQLAAGTGLGLSICKKIVDAHRGRMEVESTVGVGTTFRVFLPLGDES
jgi:signal transduction histidine kinase